MQSSSSVGQLVIVLAVFSILLSNIADAFLSQQLATTWKCALYQSTNTMSAMGEVIRAKVDISAPAIDRYVRLPADLSDNLISLISSEREFEMIAKGPCPDAPEPFKLVEKDIQPLSDFVKELVVAENPVLTMAAQHFFEKV